MSAAPCHLRHRVARSTPDLMASENRAGHLRRPSQPPCRGTLRRYAAIPPAKPAPFSRRLLLSASLSLSSVAQTWPSDVQKVNSHRGARTPNVHVDQPSTWQPRWLPTANELGDLSQLAADSQSRRNRLRRLTPTQHILKCLFCITISNLLRSLDRLGTGCAYIGTPESRRAWRSKGVGFKWC